MPTISSTDETIHAVQYLIDALKHSAPSRPLVKLGNAHKEALINIRKSNLLSSTSEGASQTGIPRKTQTGEPIINPNEK